jgi:hypothetical protein
LRIYIRVCADVEKSFRYGFYWPTVKDDAIEVLNKFRDC